MVGGNSMSFLVRIKYSCDFYYFGLLSKQVKCISVQCRSSKNGNIENGEKNGNNTLCILSYSVVHCSRLS